MRLKSYFVLPCACGYCIKTIPSVAKGCSTAALHVILAARSLVIAGQVPTLTREELQDKTNFRGQE
jgi:hypothetical protein